MWRSRAWFYKTLEKARSGDEGGRRALWEYLYVHLPTRIRAIVYARGVAHDDMEDAVHDVVVCLMDAIRRLRDPKLFDTYVFRIMQHVARTYRRPIFDPLDEQIVVGPYEDADLRLDISTVLAELPSHWAYVVRLVYIERYSYSEAAALLGCSIRAIKRMLQKARSRMRVRLAAPVQVHLYSDDLQKGQPKSEELPFSDRVCDRGLGTHEAGGRNA